MPLFGNKPRQAVYLTVNPIECARLMGEAKTQQPQAEGWCNVPTFTFSVLFLQERDNYEALCELIKSNPTELPYDKAKKLMYDAYTGIKMEEVEKDEHGPINVREIVDTLAAEILPQKKITRPRTEPRDPPGWEGGFADNH